jgi:catechol 2,3-dioxygenase-like lactoylglutathione lyase family enzyme
MPGPAPAGLFVYAKDLARMASFYQTLLGMQRVHAAEGLVVLESQQVQLVVHAIPPHIAVDIEIDVPPVRREDSALKFFFSVPGIAAARTLAAGLGGSVDDQVWSGSGMRMCNAVDPEGNIFQLRERAD